MQRSLVMLAVCGALTACGGDSDNSQNPTPIAPQAMNVKDYATLAKTEIEPVHLTPATEESLERHLKNGLRLSVSYGNLVRDGEVILFEDAALANSPTASPGPQGTPAPGAAESDGFSETNTHVRGVDEADFVKYDGEHIFMATHPEYAWGVERPNASIRILATDPINAGVAEVASIPLNDNAWGEVGRLYLTTEGEATEGLVTLRSSWSVYAMAETGFAEMDMAIYPIPYQDKVQITKYDVSTPSDPQKSFNVEIDGYLQDSRKVGNTLYLVTVFSPYLPHIQYYLPDEAAAQENENRIAALSLDELLPSVRINDGDAQPLMAAQDCLIPANAEAHYGYRNVVSLIAIDLGSEAISGVKCLNTQVSGIYANTENFYLGGSAYRDWESYDSYTVVHKFTLDTGVNYRSTGVVPGTLGWDDPAFRMDEHEGYFRIVTTSRDSFWSPVHQLNILRDSASSDAMEVVATLPNEDRPAPIGKPGEDIYAVRFEGERAFIVTFQRTDPLYILDLTAPDDPQIAGELEVPGFSSYLHPISANVMLGIGQAATDGGVVQGLKVSLYDVSDSANPEEINSMTIGQTGTHSQGLYDLRAISFLVASDSQVRFTLPISLYSEGWRWEEEALYLFEVNGLDGAMADLNYAGKIVSERRSDERHYPDYFSNSRGILHDEAVYYTHGSDVWAAFWAAPDAATGPH